MKRTNGIAINPRQRIKELEEQLANARKLGRTKREPVDGFGGVIQRRRESLGMTLTELSNNSGVSKGLISRIESDPKSSPNLRTIHSLARGLKTTASELILSK